MSLVIDLSVEISSPPLSEAKPTENRIKSGQEAWRSAVGATDAGFVLLFFLR